MTSNTRLTAQLSIDLIAGSQTVAGAYPASPAHEVYRHGWLRDGSWCAYAMDRAGKPASAAAWHRWVANTLLRQEHRVDEALAAVQAGTIDGRTMLSRRLFVAVEREPGRQAGARGGAQHDRAHGLVRQRPMRRLDAHEQRAPQRARRSPMLQIGDHRLADVGGQRQPLRAPALAMHDDFAGTPVDVIQRQPGDLTRAQAQARQHCQNREIAAPGRAAPIARRQQAPHLVWLKALGQRRQPPAAGRRHRVRQRPLDVSLGVQEPKHRAQRLHRALGRAARLSWAALDHERDHRRPVQPRHINVIRVGEALQEGTHAVHVVVRRVRQQAPLKQQIALKARQQLLHRPLRRRRQRARHRHDAKPAQVREQPLTRPRRQPLPIPSRAPRREEPSDHLAIKIGRPEALCLKPPAQMRKQLHLLGAAVRLIPRLGHGHDKPFGKRRKHAGHANPQRIDHHFPPREDERVLAIPPKRTERKLITFLTEPETKALINAPDRSTWTGRRDHALLMLAVQTGLRASELISLACRDIHLGTGAHVSCIGKGRKQRITPLTKTTAAVLRAWLAERGGQPTDRLFPTSQGRKLSRDALERRIAKHAAAAAKHCPSLHTKRVTAHVLRHTAAMRLLHADVDITVIAMWLGHEQVETTQIYLHADLAIKEQALARTKPLDAKPGRYRAPDPLLAFLEAL